MAKATNITQEQKDEIFALTKSGVSRADIVERTGLKIWQVQHQMERYRKLAGKEAKKFIRRPAAARTEPAAHKPMIALVGNPDEVTKSLRELFS